MSRPQLTTAQQFRARVESESSLAIDRATQAINALIAETKRLPVLIPKAVLTEDEVVRNAILDRLNNVAGWRVVHPHANSDHYELRLK